MKKGLELIVKSLIELALPEKKWGKLINVSADFERLSVSRQLGINLDESDIRELFSIYSQKVAELVVSDRTPDLVIARNLEEWSNRAMQKNRLPEELLPYEDVAKQVLLGRYDTSQVGLLPAENVAALLYFARTELPHIVDLVYGNEGVTFDGVVTLNPIGMKRVLYTKYYVQANNGRNLNPVTRDIMQKYANGYTKYLIVHEAAHDHLLEINSQHRRGQSAKLLLGLFEQVYNLGKALKGIAANKYQLPQEFSEREAYAVLLFSDLDKELGIGSFEPASEMDFKPLPPKIRAAFAEYKNEFVIPTAIHASIVECLSDLVADIILAGDDDYRHYKALKFRSPDKKKEFDPYTAAQHFLDGLYALVGNKMFSLLRTDPNREELKNPQLYLARVQETT